MWLSVNKCVCSSYNSCQRDYSIYTYVLWWSPFTILHIHKMFCRSRGNLPLHSFVNADFPFVLGNFPLHFRFFPWWFPILYWSNLPLHLYIILDVFLFLLGNFPLVLNFFPEWLSFFVLGNLPLHFIFLWMVSLMYWVISFCTSYFVLDDFSFVLGNLPLVPRF